jgi:hypothetical protein
MVKASVLEPQVKTASCINCPTVKVFGSQAVARNSVFLIEFSLLILYLRTCSTTEKHSRVMLKMAVSKAAADGSTGGVASGLR